MTFSQSEFDVRCEWGIAGFHALAPASDVVVIVDVLSFSTAVDIAVANGALVFPYSWKDDSAVAYALSNHADLASPDRNSSGFSLSPASLVDIPRGHRIVLPSPNGAALSLASPNRNTVTACLRNARAVAEFAAASGASFAVIPAGERWPDGSLRPCVEDVVGAGAVLSHLPGRRSPEAELAIDAFLRCEQDLRQTLLRCGSGKELIERGFARDVELAAQVDVSASVPWLDRQAGAGAFREFRGAQNST